jgi:hypothetical protein
METCDGGLGMEDDHRDVGVEYRIGWPLIWVDGEPRIGAPGQKTELSIARMAGGYISPLAVVP